MTDGQEVEFDLDDMLEDLNDAEISPKLKISIFGAPGVGKTELACSFPRPLLIDIDLGALTVFGKNIKRFPYTGMYPDGERYPIQNFMEDIHGWISEHLDDYDTVIIDTVSELQLKHVLEIAQGASRKNPTKRPNPLKTEIQDYGENLQWMREMIRAYKSLPLHSVFVSHEVEVQDDDKIWRIRPHVTPKFAPDFLGHVDICTYMSVDSSDDSRFIVFKPQEKISSKARIRRHVVDPSTVPDKLYDPSFEAIMKIMMPDVKLKKAKASSKPKSRRKK